eukprot:scaffold102659_cov28-Tisochrysis_lutea.AAC.2
MGDASSSSPPPPPPALTPVCVWCCTLSTCFDVPRLAGVTSRAAMEEEEVLVKDSLGPAQPRRTPRKYTPQPMIPKRLLPGRRCIC